MQVPENKQISGTFSFLIKAKNSGFEQVFSGNLVGNRIPFCMRLTIDRRACDILIKRSILSEQ